MSQSPSQPMLGPHMRRANLQACGTERGGCSRRAPELSTSQDPHAGAEDTPSPVPAGQRGQRGTHFDNLRLRVLEVQQQRHQPVQDLLEEDLAVAFAELGQFAEEDDGGLAEVRLLLRAEGTSRAQREPTCAGHLPIRGMHLARLLPPPTTSLLRLEGIRAAKETLPSVPKPQHLLPRLPRSSAAGPQLFLFVWLVFENYFRQLFARK